MDMNKDDGTRRPSRRGFAAMDPERRREIARRGERISVPREKRSFAQDRDLAAQRAGRKGGAASSRRRTPPGRQSSPPRRR